MDGQLEPEAQKSKASHLLDGRGRPDADPADAKSRQGLRIERSLDQRLGKTGCQWMCPGEKRRARWRRLSRRQTHRSAEIVLRQTLAQTGIKGIDMCQE